MSYPARPRATLGLSSYGLPPQNVYELVQLSELPGLLKSSLAYRESASSFIRQRARTIGMVSRWIWNLGNKTVFQHSDFSFVSKCESTSGRTRALPTSHWLLESGLERWSTSLCHSQEKTEHDPLLYNQHWISLERITVEQINSFC